MSKVKFRYKLFISITILITSIVVLSSSFTYYTSSSNLKENEHNSSKSIASRVSSQIDQLYNQMDIATTSLINSPQLKNALYSISNDEQSLSEFEKIQQEKIIQNNLATILFFPNISNVLLYNSKVNYFYYSGYYLKDSNYTYNELKNNDYNVHIKNMNSKVILPPHINPWKPDSIPVISLYKNFSNNFITEDTILEVQVPYKVFEKICTQDTFDNHKSILIFDENFNLIYPFNPDLDYLKTTLVEEIKSKLEKDILQGETKDYSYTVSQSDYTKFNTVLLSSNSYISTQRFNSILSTIVLTVLILLITLSALFFIIRRLLNPLNELIEHINTITIGEESKLCIKDNSFDEFSVINDSFNKMVDELKISTAQVYESKLREINASFVALQAQINPHFLYNTLNSISAASEIYGSEVTTKMCQDLSFMMRYITSYNEEVTLIEEINHTRNYLELMLISNGDNFSYTIDMPIETYDFPIPKLIIQPLVENCFKHGFSDSLQPWNIKITCIITSNIFKIEIEDSGNGFNQKALEDFNNFSNEYTLRKHSDLYKDLIIGGLGLKNIYSRLNIFYKDNIKFKIDNTNNGSKITIERMIGLD